MAANKWTPAQSDAINARGGSLLVSAAAGSGKTAVLVERAVGLICDEKKPADADKLLIVTFSNAAAAELRQRMSARLSEMLRQEPENLFLQRQKALLGSAQISTIHSFCLELLRANFQKTDISPDFTVADENELRLMKAECAARCVEKMYRQDKNGDFARLVELLATGRDDSRITETALKIYEFSRSHPFFEDWLDEKEAMYGTGLPASKTVWGKSILRYARETLAFCTVILLRAETLAKGDEKLDKAYGDPIRNDLRQLASCVEAAEAGEWDALSERLAAFSFARLGSVRGDDPDKERIKQARAKSKEKLQKLAAGYLNVTEAGFAADLDDLRPKIAVLFGLVKLFAAEFAAAKAEKNRLDFADLEHLTLSLLVTKKDGKYERTPQAAEIAERFEHVLVDEYQDANEVQDLIFVSVSRQQENLFMVGDVKQSIYAFRQAMPEIFIARRKAAFPYATGMFPAKINLDANFRSRREVTGAVNFLFGRMMSEKLGDVDYNGAESLKCGAAYPEYAGAEPEFMLTGLANYTGEKEAEECEAAAVAEKIAGMLKSGYMVAENGSMRPAAPRDFCILLRAPKNRAAHYIKELAARGVPAWADGGSGYLAAREVSAVLSLLKAVDNPLRDIELVAAMMSPYFGFTGDDIAKIRLKLRGAPFYSALTRAAEEGGKAAGFLKTFTELRGSSAFMPADRLIMRFYDITGALGIARAMKNGATRVKNLRLLAEYAADFHRLGYKQLGGFVHLIDRLEEQGEDLAPASLLGDGANVVRIMSAHRSKGLEFPVAILAGCGHAFNKQDLRAAFLLHSEYGFACVRREPSRRIQFPTAPLMSVRLECERTMLSEEMRILYVALTRAREKLIVSACFKQDLQKKIAGLAHSLENGKLPASALKDGGCLADWIIAALLHNESAENPWKLTLNEPVADHERTRIEEAPEEQEFELVVHGKPEFTYRHESATKIPSKLAVSAVAHSESAMRHRFAARPRFMTEQRLTPAEKGSAMHRFMQFASYLSARDNLEGEIDRMARERFLSGAEAESLDRARLRAFFSSGLARRIFASADVRRELRFMAECGRELLEGIIPEGEPEARIVLQGVADCVFFERGEAVVVDYKTDHVTDENTLLERYSGQLELYAAILGKGLGARVKECVIYSFALSKAIAVEQSLRGGFTKSRICTIL